MDERYRRYNELTFVIYCMKSIDRAISHGRQEKAQKAQIEVSLSSLGDLDTVLPAVYANDSDIDLPETIFYVDGMAIPIYNPDLTAALRAMPPKKRDILLIAYILGDNDIELAEDLHISKSAAQRRRSAALKRIKTLIGSPNENNPL